MQNVTQIVSAITCCTQKDLGDIYDLYKAVQVQGFMNFFAVSIIRCVKVIGARFGFAVKVFDCY